MTVTAHPSVIAARTAIDAADRAAFSALHAVGYTKARAGALDARTHATQANSKAITTEGNVEVIIECLGLAQDATVLALTYTTGVNSTLALARSFAALQAAVVAVQAVSL